MMYHLLMVLQALHFIQIIRSGRFQLYDYGSRQLFIPITQHT
jgi:hypothetical protein